MKQIVTAFAIVGIILTIMAFKNSLKQSEGSIGDVKYSVLPIDKFKEQNGDGWVLMDDKIPLKGSDLGDEGITEVPDARGLFIRGLNVNRSDDKADKFKEENGRERLMGEVQADGIISHTHPMNYELGRSDSWGGGWGSGAGGQTAVNSPGTTKHVTTAYGIGETRPKNVALFIYIKINE